MDYRQGRREVWSSPRAVVTQEERLQGVGLAPRPLSLRSGLAWWRRVSSGRGQEAGSALSLGDSKHHRPALVAGSKPALFPFVVV